MTHDDSTQVPPPNQSSSATSGNDALNELIADYLQQMDDGTAPDRDAFIAAHLDFEFGLREFFADVDHFEPAATRAAPAQDSETPRIRYFGEYELTREIARGGMGVVYEAHQTTLNRTVAVKMILAGMLASEEDVKRFRTEAQAAAGLQHAGIVSIHEVGVSQGQHYFSMDFVDGWNLADLVRDASLPVDKAARYVKLIAEAVHFAHVEGILHRDLKPSNILIDSRTDEPRITDFGLAKLLDADSGLTATGARLGTPSYMSPEQASGEAERVGPATDIYSLGAVLYELLTGRPPFRGSTAMQTLNMVINRHPVPPRQLNPEIPKDIETVCLKCLSKAPEDRYESADALAADLGRFLNDEPVQARRIGPLERAGRRVWKHRRTVFSIAALVCVAVGLEVARQRQAAWEESQKGTLSFQTDGPPLTTTIRNDNGQLAIPRFTSPTAEPVWVGAGDYQMELAASGELSATYRMFVEAGREVDVPVGLPPAGVVDCVTYTGHLRVVQLNGRSAVLVLSDQTLTCIDLLTQDTQWERSNLGRGLRTNGPPETFAGRAGDLQRSRPLSPLWDIDGDGTDDIVWPGRGDFGAVAFSGADGSTLWLHEPETDRTGATLVGLPALITTTDDAPPDLLMTFERRHSESEQGSRSRWIERVSGRTGEVLWKYAIASPEFGLWLPAVAAVPVSHSGSNVVVVPSGESLVRLDAETGTDEVVMASDPMPFTRATVHDLDGDGQPELLAEFSKPHAGLTTTAIDVASGRTLWSHNPQRWHAAVALIAHESTTPGCVIVGSAEDPNGTGGGRTYEVELLDSATGTQKWSDQWAVHSSESVGESLQVFAAPDLNADGHADALASWRQEPEREISTVFVRAWSGADGARLWDWSTRFDQHPRPPIDTDIQFWSTGQDGLPRLVVSCPFIRSDYDYAGSGTTFILAARTGQREATLTDAPTPFVADLNADGISDLYWKESDSEATRNPPVTLRTLAGRSPEAWRRIGNVVPATDFDGDGNTDLLGRDMFGHLFAVSGRSGQVLWHAEREPGAPTEGYMGLPMPQGDLDGDGCGDLLEMRRAKGGNDLIATSGRTGQIIWTQPGWVSSRYSATITFAQCVESSVDGRKQLIFAAPTSFSPKTTHLAALDPDTGSTLWREPSTTQRQHSVRRYEINVERNELVSIRHIGRNERRVTVRSLTDGRILWQHDYNVRNSRSTDQRGPLPIADLNGDGVREVLSIESTSRRGPGGMTGGTMLTAKRVDTGEPVWTWSPEPKTPEWFLFRGLALGDFVIADFGVSDRKSVCFLLRNRLLVLDGAGQEEELRLDLDQWGFYPAGSTLLAADQDADGRDELLITGTATETTDPESSLLVAFDTERWEIKWEWPMPAGFGDVFAINTQSDGQVEIITGSGNTIYALDGSGDVLWTCTGPAWDRPGTDRRRTAHSISVRISVNDRRFWATLARWPPVCCSSRSSRRRFNTNAGSQFLREELRARPNDAR